MLIRKSYKFRLKTNKATANALARSGGTCRYVWNKALALQKDRLDNEQTILNYGQLCEQVKLWKSEPETPWLGCTHSQPLQQTLKNLDRALRDAFDKTSPKCFPRFKKKGCGDSFRYPQGFKLEGNRVYLPKIGWVRYYKSREITGTPKNLTVSEQGGHWFISIQCEVHLDPPVHESTSWVGIDMGVRRFATLSDGSFLEPLNSFRKLERKLAKAQRKLSRKVKFSSNWKKQKRKIARIHTRIAHARRDYLHKSSTMISKNHAVIVLENLQVSNMSASATGTLEEPGKNVRAKSGLNKSILDQGWYEFRRQITYKQDWCGGRTILINPRNTSRKCPGCGHVAADNRKGESFRCLACGYAQHADLVGAINILAAGHAVSACGETALVASMKQEPLGAAA